MTIKTKNLKEKKVKAVKNIKEKLSLSKLIVLTNYKGMTVKQITELRRQLRLCNAEFKVFKNTYVVKALSQELESLEPSLKEPIAMLLGYDDVVSPAKMLMTFIGENEKPMLVCGFLEGQQFTDEQIKQLAKLPSKKELLAKVVYGFKSPLYNVVSVMQGPLRKLVYALEAIKNKKSQGGEG